MPSLERGDIVVASAARTATGNSAAIEEDAVDRFVSLLADVTAVSGTGPTLDLKVQWSQDGGTTFADAEPVDSFAQITAAKVVVKEFANKGSHFRVVWTIAGTLPSFTFSVRRFATGG